MPTMALMDLVGCQPVLLVLLPLLALEMNQMGLELQALTHRMARCPLMVWKVWALMDWSALQRAGRPMAMGSHRMLTMVLMDLVGWQLVLRVLLPLLALEMVLMDLVLQAMAHCLLMVWKVPSLLKVPHAVVDVLVELVQGRESRFNPHVDTVDVQVELVELDAAVHAPEGDLHRQCPSHGRGKRQSQ